MSPRRKPSRADRRIFMRPTSRAPAPVVWARWAATAPERCAGVAAGGFLNERAGTTRAAGRATDPVPLAGKSRRIGRSVCCLTASCISTFGAPIKAPGAGKARPGAFLAGGACNLRDARFGVVPGIVAVSRDTAGPALSATGLPCWGGRCATSARNCRSVRRNISAGWQSRNPPKPEAADVRFYLLPL